MELPKAPLRPAHAQTSDFTAAELGAIAHLYRGEIYRSTVWRTRLDTTTNWSVVTLGVALSLVFASPEASAVPLMLVGVLITILLVMETRRYRYFNVWRARARWMETNFYAPMLSRQVPTGDRPWQIVLASDYIHPEYHVGFLTALGRRVRRNYLWILLIQFGAYLSKLAVHPLPVTGIHDLLGRATLGAIPGSLVLSAGSLYVSIFFLLAIWSKLSDRGKWKASRGTMVSGG
ncbi:DUF2270 domain-containing protein [Paracoccus angustae]|uniref:DUF2270 domain-containing protein n=1 Tax=Paracoccus angustae TaxID=1671480 RepID=A0ABV7U781_9RHOB